MTGLRLTVEEAAALGIKLPSTHKYHAKPQRLDGVRFDSHVEMLRYAYLVQVEMARQLEDLEIHPRLTLFADGGGRGAIEVGQYEADFAYTDARGRVVEDVKGLVLPLYKLKRRLLLANYPTILFFEVRQCRKKWTSNQVTCSPWTETISPP